MKLLRRSKPAGPTDLQYINRLIEHYDGEFIWLAAQEFLTLVDSGIDPDHAFRMLTEQ